ncbi:uncharacterized protein N7511_010448 [Penicillium nucicola]|uniref:uncharacterized protein n=1 Tax=Penicillium nucicola TaxID=1850975 RepID=UPI0025456363|nr:uncharacterized protein N7511_010448 [Penicillium nucicola]KAJ5748752.1 hypothetical protein N7511_010448 [Penicillium nucicola]
MDSIVAQIKALADTANEAGRLEIIKTLQQVKVDLQTPKDVLFELVGLGGTTIAMLRVGQDLGIFDLLSKTEVSISVAQVAERVDAAPELLERVLRHLGATNTIKETGPNEYTANDVTQILGSPFGEGLIHQAFNLYLPLSQATPTFFAENNYKDVIDNRHTPLQKAFDTKLTSFEWFFQHPEYMEAMHKTMGALQGTEWTEGFTLLETEIQKVTVTPPTPKSHPFLVDIGGSHGHQCIELAKKYPSLLNHLVLQDLPVTVDKLAPIEGVKVEAYNFFETQPVKDAKFYYLRRIMHDWPDDKAAQILVNTAAAMGPDSRILIDDVVMPETGANWQATMADISMMILAGRERSRSQYEHLAKLAGLQVQSVHSYAASTYTAIVVMVKE